MAKNGKHLTTQERAVVMTVRNDPWSLEGDLIKGAAIRSSAGTLVARTTGFVVLAKMDNATTKAVVDTERIGVQIYFADPHSPWQRGSNENTKVLLRQYMPRAPTCGSAPGRTRSHRPAAEYAPKRQARL